MAQRLDRERGLIDALRQPDGVRAILSLLHRELERDVWLITTGAVFSPERELVPDNDDLAAVVDALPLSKSPADLLLAGERTATAFELRRDGERGPAAGHLMFETTQAPLSDDEHLAIAQALGFMSIALAERRAQHETRRGMAEEFMRRASTGRADAEELAAWTRGLGVKPEGHVVCVVAHAPRAGDAQTAELAVALDDLAAAHGVPRIAVAGQREAVAFLFAGSMDEALEGAVYRSGIVLAPLLGRLEGAMGTSSVIANGVADVVRTLHDARRVCQLNHLHGELPDAPARRPDAALTTLLLADNDEARVALHAALLAPLAAYDEEHGSELIWTLDVFLSGGGQWSQSANKLGVHVNTLRYRLGRVEKCTGRDLASMDDRVDFYVALRLRDAEARASGSAPSGRVQRARQSASTTWPR